MKSKTEVAAKCRELLADPDLVVIDLETTDKNPQTAAIVQIAAIDGQGDILLNKLINPKCLISEEAIRVHGITPQKVMTQATFGECAAYFARELRGKHWLIYNADFDATILKRLFSGVGVECEPKAITCAMKLYAVFAGVLNSPKWWRLTDACERESIQIEQQAHSAIGDVRRTLALVQAMAAYQPSASTASIEDPLGSDLERFARAVKAMRECQTRYFATRSSQALKESKLAEMRVDKWLERLCPTPAKPEQLGLGV